MSRLRTCDGCGRSLFHGSIRIMIPKLGTLKDCRYLCRPCFYEYDESFLWIERWIEQKRKAVEAEGTQ